MSRTPLLALLMVAGCAQAPIRSASGSDLVLTVQSDPPGATISHMVSGLSGASPAAFYYGADWFRLMKDASGCVTAPGFVARWPDGTRASLDQMRLCGPPDGRYTLTVRSAAAQAARSTAAAARATPQERPQLEGGELAVEVLRAITPAAVILMDRPRAPVPPPAAVSCTSYQLGTVTKTNCR